jgi:hypothetical protein
MTAVAESVARGAALLDEKLPGWDERIDLADLQLASCYRCVLGQLFGRYPVPAEGGFSPYGLGIAALGIGDENPSRYGFDGRDADSLTGEWRRVITQRRTRVPAGATT